MAGNPFDVYDSVLVSSAWVTGEEWAMFAAEVSWDMVIVDEAHHARVRVAATGAKRRGCTRWFENSRRLTHSPSGRRCS